MTLSIYDKHQSIFSSEDDRLNANINSKEFLGRGYIESILISWDLSAYDDENNRDMMICGNTGIKFNTKSHWHCDLCCIKNKCHIVNNKDDCCGCTCYTNIATDYDLTYKRKPIYTYIWKTREGHVIEVGETFVEI
jgi:hypothetical protein